MGRITERDWFDDPIRMKYRTLFISGLDGQAVVDLVLALTREQARDEKISKRRARKLEKDRAFEVLQSWRMYRDGNAVRQVNSLNKTFRERMDAMMIQRVRDIKAGRRRVN